MYSLLMNLVCFGEQMEHFLQRDLVFLLESYQVHFADAVFGLCCDVGDHVPRFDVWAGWTGASFLVGSGF